MIRSVQCAPYSGGRVRPDLARGQHGDEESLDHDRLLLRVGVLARHVHMRGQAVVEWRQLHHRSLVGEGELKLAKLHAQHTDAAHLVRVRVRVWVRVQVRVRLRASLRAGVRVWLA